MLFLSTCIAVSSSFLFSCANNSLHATYTWKLAKPIILQAPCEAEAQCAELVKGGKVCIFVLHQVFYRWHASSVL